MSRRRAVVLVLLCSVYVTPGPAAVRMPDAAARAVDAISPADLRRYVETLAGDSFRGRGAGDEGNRAAETYICATLVRAGVSPAGADGSCYQTVEVYSPRLGSMARLTVHDDRGTLLDLTAGTDFYPLPETGDASVEAPLAFAASGAAAARDTIAVVPDEESHEKTIADATTRGARGVLIVSRYLQDVQGLWPDHPSVRSAQYRLLSSLRAQPAPVGLILESTAAPLRRAHDEGRTLVARFAPGVVVSPIQLHNVLGLVDGRDVKKREEMVVVGAHLDHDGIDEDGRIYKGADDNASGTAAVMAAAAAFAHAAAAGERPARAVLFALWNGEEKGSLGAEAFVQAPQPNRRLVANLNLDMVGRREEIPDPSDWRFSGFPKVDAAASANTLHLLGYSYSASLAADVREANAAVGLAIKEDYDRGAQGLLQRSDQWPFLLHGVPAVFLTTGLHPDYHTPADEADRIDFEKLERVTKLAARAAWIVADGPRVPRIDKR